MLASVKDADRNSASGSIGLCTRRSTASNRTSDTTPNASAPGTSGLRTPRAGHSSNPNTMPPRPRTASAAPAQSIRDVRDGSRLSSMKRSDSTMTMIASGRLRKKTARQLTCSTSQPPLTGPIAVVIALNPDQTPIARPRSRLSNVALMMARLPGTRKAAPMPCSARPTTSAAGDAAIPHHAEAAVKKTTPKRKTRLRPN